MLERIDCFKSLFINSLFLSLINKRNNRITCGESPPQSHFVRK